VAIVLLAFGALNIVETSGSSYAATRPARVVPLVGGVFAFAGCALLPMIG